MISMKGLVCMMIEIPRMIDILEEFVNSSKKSIIVGGIVGTEIERYAMEAALMTTSFPKILVINGCQDYIGLMKKQLPNVIFWGDLFYEQLIESYKQYDIWLPRCMNPKPEYGVFINSKILMPYDFIVIFNMHLIPVDRIRQIQNNFGGKLILVCDPFESLIYNYLNITGQGDIPIITDTLRKVSPMIALARSVYQQPSRGIDTRVAGNLVEINRFHKKNIINKTMNFRQYVTTDQDLFNEIVDEQKQIPIRKNQSFIVDDDIIDIMLDNMGTVQRTLTKHSMIIAQDIDKRPFMKFRLYNSKITYFCDITYERSLFSERYQVRVIPANLIMIDDVKYHRFKQMTVIVDRQLRKHERYTLFKNTTNVSIVNKKNMKGVD